MANTTLPTLSASTTVAGTDLLLSRQAGTSDTKTTVTQLMTYINSNVTAPAGALTGTTLNATVVTSSLTSVGTIGTGVWQGTAITGQYGGTGVANTGKTITIGGNLTTSGAFASTFTMTNTTTVTFPTTGTLATTANLTNLSPATIGFTISGSPVATGKVLGFFTANYAGTISGWSITADAGTATMKVWKIANGTAKPTVANVINTSGVALATGTHIRSSTVTDFTTTTVTAGDVFAFELTAVSGVAELSGAIEITRS